MEIYKHFCILSEYWHLFYVNGLSNANTICVFDLKFANDLLDGILQLISIRHICRYCHSPHFKHIHEVLNMLLYGPDLMTWAYKHLCDKHFPGKSLQSLLCNSNLTLLGKNEFWMEGFLRLLNHCKHLAFQFETFKFCIARIAKILYLPQNT